MDCGCRVKIEVFADPEASAKILYCPKHAHVDQVVEALKEVIQWADWPDNQGFYGHSFVIKAREALATVQPCDPNEPAIGKDGTQ